MRDVTLDDNYSVDRNGNVYSKRRKKMLTPKLNHDGYLRIQLWRHNKCRFVGIHRLVLKAYDPRESYEGLVTNHINGIKDDNRLENLEWVTQSENIQHAMRTGLIDFEERKNNPSTSIPVTVYQDGKNLGNYPSISEASRQLEVPRPWLLTKRYQLIRNETCND